MKVLIFLLLASSYCLSHPAVKTWTFHELSHAVERMMSLDSNDEDADKKSIFDAFDQIMQGLYSGKDDYLLTLMLSPSGASGWTKEELESAMNDPLTDPDLLPFIGSAHQTLIELNSRGDTVKMDTARVWVPALDISTWTQEDITTALRDLKTKGPMYYHLERAQEQFNEAKVKGEKRETVSLITPVGLILQKGTNPRFITKKPIYDTFIIENPEQDVASLHHSTRLWKHRS